MDNPQEEVLPMERDLEFLEVAAPAVRLTATGSPSTPRNLANESEGEELHNEVDDEVDDEDEEDANVIDVGSLIGEGKRKFRSKAWREYVPIYEDGEITKGECMHCTTLIGAKRGAGTSALRNHLKRCKIRLEKVRVVDQLHATLMSPNGVSMGKWTFDQEVSRRELVRMIVLHELPFSIVEYDGFQKFVSSLNPLFKMISRGTVKNDCMKMFEDQKNALKKELKCSKSRISLTMDLWTSNQTLGYMCITCHYIDADWKLQKKIIKFSVLETPHTGLAMFNAVLKCIQEWNFENKLFAITLDNASNNGSMVKLLKENLLAKGVIVGQGKFLHQRCAAHVLNLICQAGLEFIDGTVTKIRESVKYIRGSQGRKERFNEIVTQQGITCSKCPSYDVVTRWNSTFLMLDVAQQYRKAFDSLAVQDPLYKYKPTPEEWERADLVCRLLKVFYDATNVISATKYPTSNLYFHKIWQVMRTLEKESSEANEGVSDMVNAMKDKFDKYWKLSWMALCIPIILDPRFKYSFLVFRFGPAFGSRAKPRLERLKTTFEALFNEYAQQMINVGSMQQGSGDVEMDIGSCDELADWDQHVSLAAPPRIVASSELKNYLSKPPLPRSEPFDILKWWQANSIEFPVLSRMAQDILAVSASTVPSESAFSTGSRVVSEFRSRLTPETTEALICLQDWIRESSSSSSELSTESIFDYTIPDPLPEVDRCI